MFCGGVFVFGSRLSTWIYYVLWGHFVGRNVVLVERR